VSSVKVEKIFEGVFRIGKHIATRNLVPGKKVYGEKTVVIDGAEYRIWEPERSKVCAAILNGLRCFPIREGSKVLYLGAATGTTCSHLSDIVKHKGVIYSVEFSPRVFREFVVLAESRRNLIPILADARKPADYFWVESVDVVYCDIAQPDEVNIAMRNADEFLKEGGYMMIAIKSRSIDVTKEPKEIYALERKKLEGRGFETVELVELDPYERDHAMIVVRKRATHS